MTVLSVLVEATLVLPAASLATPAAMLAMTVPELGGVATATLNVLGPPVTVPLVAPAVPLTVTSPLTKVLPTLSLNTTAKLIGPALAGSAWPTAWLMVTVGFVASTVTVSAADAAEALPAASLDFAVML